jgi:hypothetical protein
MVVTHASVIKAEPLPDPSPFHVVVWYQTVHGNDRIGVVSSDCANGIAMIQDVCDSVTLALSIKGCPELSTMITGSLSKEFTQLVFLLVAPYGIELFRSDLCATLAVDAVPTLTDDERKQILILLWILNGKGLPLARRAMSYQTNTIVFTLINSVHLMDSSSELKSAKNS